MHAPGENVVPPSWLPVADPVVDPVGSGAA
jgi:hypothetical protein